jgi:hypothetical protein
MNIKSKCHKCSSFTFTFTWIDNFVKPLYIYFYVVWNFSKIYLYRVHMYPTDFLFEIRRLPYPLDVLKINIPI